EAAKSRGDAAEDPGAGEGPGGQPGRTGQQTDDAPRTDDEARAGGEARVGGEVTDVSSQAEDLIDLKTKVASLPDLLGMSSDDIGSNSWVISGEHTETGSPLLANDPHLSPTMPSVWY